MSLTSVRSLTVRSLTRRLWSGLVRRPWLSAALAAGAYLGTAPDAARAQNYTWNATASAAWLTGP